MQSTFSKQRKTVARNLAITILSLIRSDSCSITKIAMKMGVINDKSFNTNEKRITRFFDSNCFQVDDKLFRQYINMVFQLLSERGFDLNKKIAINVDFTSSTDDFLILSASIPFLGRSIPLYFSMRNYPKYKGQLDQIKMEQAFIKQLKHLLPKHYQYVIVADRGFGNGRFANLCQDNDFSFILRTKDDFRIKSDNFANIKRVKDFTESNFDFPEAVIIPWNNKVVRMIKISDKGSKWNIVSDINKVTFSEITHQYSNRFKCEKMFQDKKSSGFNLEKSKIKKYDRFKKLLFCITAAQMLMMFIGDYINDNVGDIKKKLYYHLNLISAFSNSQKDLYPTSSTK